MSYPARMHELALAENLLALTGQEMQKRGLRRLLALRVRCGALAGVMPEALEFAFFALLQAGAAAAAIPLFQDARLEIVREPLRLRCFDCARVFESDQGALFTACPFCGYEFFHQICDGRSGAEIFLDCLEAE